MRSRFAGAIAITPDGKTAYVLNEGTVDHPASVTPISLATNTSGKPIKAGNDLWAMAVTPNGKTLYIVNFSPGTVTPAATATNTPGKPIKIGAGADAIAITP
jgi:hyaluronoglucosaminidase